MYKAYAGFKNIYLIFILINLSLFTVLISVIMNAHQQQ